MAEDRQDPPKGKRLVFVKWFIHPKTKRKVFPRNGKVFRFYVDN